MFVRRLVPWCVLSCAILGCSDGSSSTATPTSAPHVVIDAVFTTQPDSTQGIGTPPNRQPLGPVTLPCDGYLGVRFTYENWSGRAPGLCGETKNCGHAALTLALGERTSETMVIASPALFALTDLANWAGTTTLRVELRNDDGSAHLFDGAPIQDEIDVPLSPTDCTE